MYFFVLRGHAAPSGAVIFLVFVVYKHFAPNGATAREHVGWN
jgi:hypothetical protein